MRILPFITPIRYCPAPRTKQPSESGLTAVIRYSSRENRSLLRRSKYHEKAKSAQARYELGEHFYIKTDYPVVIVIGSLYGVNHARKKGSYKTGPFPLPESRTEREAGHPGRVHQHYRCKNREYALRILNKPQTAEAFLFVKGKALKLKPPKKRPANRKGRKIYTGAAVREYVGYDRLEGETLRNRLAAVCRSLVPLLNFFMPAMKLESKVKAGSKEIKNMTNPAAPASTLLESEALSSGVKAELTRLCGLYNPAQLQHNANKAILALREVGAAQSPFFGKGTSGLKLLFEMRHYRPSEEHTN
jgi:hypothetical protein